MILNSCEYLHNRAYDLSLLERRHLLAKLEYMDSPERSAAIEVLRIAGIKVAYNWVGHRGEYFFPTFEDALMEEDWEFQCADL